MSESVYNMPLCEAIRIFTPEQLREMFTPSMNPVFLSALLRAAEVSGE